MLDLNELEKGLPAISSSFGKALAEAGGVCFESQSHRQGVLIEIRGFSSTDYSLNWPTITDQIRRNWNDPEEATEFGATAVAVLLIKKEVGFSVINRARKGKGFDYWLGDEDSMPFQNKARLEISGIRSGKYSHIKSRLKKKLKQTEPSDGLLPAYIVVVEFSKPAAEIRDK
ncbi:MAG: hypothetical protein KQH59_03575 [Desulfobulbaceae bacterium]|nr:hypothetical protein [Desulfobulbaceae bacterium]